MQSFLEDFIQSEFCKKNIQKLFSVTCSFQHFTQEISQSKLYIRWALLIWKDAKYKWVDLNWNSLKKNLHFWVEYAGIGGRWIQDRFNSWSSNCALGWCWVFGSFAKKIECGYSCQWTHPRIQGILPKSINISFDGLCQIYGQVWSLEQSYFTSNAFFIRKAWRQEKLWKAPWSLYLKMEERDFG